MKKRGQVTIFIIIAIIIVVLGIMVFLLYPKISSTSVSTSPNSFLQNCLKTEIENVVEQISLQGGSINPEFFAKYNQDNIQYLCYSSEYYKQCVMQKPLLRKEIESEIKKAIKQKSEQCFEELKNNYEGDGYSVSLEKKNYSVLLSPGRINVNFEYPLTLTKGSSNKYNEFNIILNSNLYELVSISKGILDSEVRYGDADLYVYMNAYPWLKAEKRTMTDGTTIYILEDKKLNDKFQFASRSVAWPPGY